MKHFGNLFKLLVGIVFISVIGSCSKDRISDKKEDTLNKYGSLNSFYEMNRPPEQTYVVDRNGTGPIVGLNGTKIWVDSTIFQHPNGDPVTYPFTIKLVELYTPKDMILYNMPSVGGGKVLTTAGEVRVRAFKGTEDLVLKPSKVYRVDIPGLTIDPQMEIFYGWNKGSFVDWTNNISDIGNTSGGLASITPDNGFWKMLIPQMGWVSCAKNFTPSGKSTVQFTSSTDDLTNVAKFLYFPNVKSVVQVYTTTSGEVPVGESVKLICFAADANGKLFYYTKNFTIATSNAVDVKMEAVTEQALLSYLANL